MDNKPIDTSNQCNAILYIPDDYGDNKCTMCCQLPKGHVGRHVEEYEADDDRNIVIISWDKDERRDRS